MSSVGGRAITTSWRRAPSPGTSWSAARSATGGNCQADWRNIPDLANIGYPIIEAEPDGTFVITKHAGTGGRVSLDSVKEQLLYELGDPKRYLTPDCVADFTTIQLNPDGENRVRVTGIRGGERPPVVKGLDQFRGWMEGHRDVGLFLAGGAGKSACGRRDCA